MTFLWQKGQNNINLKFTEMNEPCDIFTAAPYGLEERKEGKY